MRHDGTGSDLYLAAGCHATQLNATRPSGMTVRRDARLDEAARWRATDDTRRRVRAARGKTLRSGYPTRDWTRSSGRAKPHRIERRDGAKQDDSLRRTAAIPGYVSSSGKPTHGFTLSGAAAKRHLFASDSTGRQGKTLPTSGGYTWRDVTAFRLCGKALLYLISCNPAAGLDPTRWKRDEMLRQANTGASSGAAATQRITIPGGAAKWGETNQDAAARSGTISRHEAAKRQVTPSDAAAP